MNLKQYAEFTDTTAVYPEAGSGSLNEMMYLALGLAGEAGEVANKVKKIYRQDGNVDPTMVAKELGGVIWYWVRLARLVSTPDAVIQTNAEELSSRAVRGVLKGSGDDR